MKKNQIKVCSRDEMDGYVRSYKYLLEYVDIISINDPEDGYLIEPNQVDGQLLSLMYKDITPQTVLRFAGAYNAKALFNRTQAIQVIEFLLNRDPSRPLFVHCYAGISRSGATAVAAAMIYGFDLWELKNQHPWISPNPWVLSLLVNVWENEFEKRKPEKTIDIGSVVC